MQTENAQVANGMISKESYKRSEPKNRKKDLTETSLNPDKMGSVPQPCSKEWLHLEFNELNPLRKALPSEKYDDCALAKSPNYQA